MSGRNRTAITLIFMVLLAGIAPTSSHAQEIDVYVGERAKLETGDRTVKGYRVRVRTTLAHSVRAVLDATHDHEHLSEMDKDIKREEVVRANCTEEICLINVHVLVGSFFPVGKITYELVTEIDTAPDGSLLIEWDKHEGTRFIKHLHGELRLTPVDETGPATEVDYLIEVAASRLSLNKVTARAVAYLERLATILEERHEGHPSLWELIESGSEATE